MGKGVVLYLGGFILPDKNAAAQRVVGIAKGLRELGFEVVFANGVDGLSPDARCEKQYFGFKTLEYGREPATDYLVTAKTALRTIDFIAPDHVIVYNYPAASLNRIIKHCRKKGIRCIADVTEWSTAASGSVIYRTIKKLDTLYRMKTVHKKTDGVIAVSRYLFDYYRDRVRTVVIPPTVDIKDKKWETSGDKKKAATELVYAGSPSAVKERLDLIVDAVEKAADSADVRVDVLGITEEQFAKIYRRSGPAPASVRFLGRVDHKEAIEAVKKADWSVIIRDNNRVVRAGFPTKLVESISCGTPVIANRFSDVDLYLDESNGVIAEDTDSLPEVIRQCTQKTVSPNRELFDYRNYLEALKTVFEV